MPESATTRKWAQRLEDTVAALREGVEYGEPLPLILRDLCPTIYHQIGRCGVLKPINELWALSSNFDELAQGQIVDSEIVGMIGELCAHDYSEDTFHAGYLHTYGYLLSTLETPYGLKRNRWIRPTLDQVMGFPSATLQTHPKKGALLMNLTFFMGKLVFQPRSVESDQLAELERKGISSHLAEFSPNGLKRQRIIEKYARPKGFEIWTDLIELPNPQDGLVSLLVYSIRLPDGVHRLVTLFPLFEAAVADLTAEERFGENRTDLVLQYNGVYQDLAGKKRKGSRSLVDAD